MYLVLHYQINLFQILGGRVGGLRETNRTEPRRPFFFKEPMVGTTGELVSTSWAVAAMNVVAVQ
jgi:hypothetical protein